MFLAFISLFIIYLYYCFLVASWSRFYRMNYKFYTPAPFLIYSKRYYIVRWTLFFLFLVTSFLVNFPFWLVIISTMIIIWLGRQYTAIKLNLEFREMQRQGDLKDENENPLTPLEALNLAIKAEKMWVEARKKNYNIW